MQAMPTLIIIAYNIACWYHAFTYKGNLYHTKTKFQYVMVWNVKVPNTNIGVRLRGASVVRATSHTSQEPWPWNCESPKESVQKPSQYTSKIM